LEIPPALWRTVRVSDGDLEFADLRAGLDKVREAFFQHDVPLKFIEFVVCHGTRKIQTVLGIAVAHAFFCFAMADTRPGAHTIENDFVTSPILSQHARLGFAGSRELVVIRLKKGSLCVANQKNASHASPEELRVLVERTCANQQHKRG
jgi:hypothetical protein